MNRINKTKKKKTKKENITDEYIDLSRFFELASNNKIYVSRLNLHEIETKILLDYKGDFEMIESMLIGEVEQKTNVRFENNDDIETYINAIDVNYDSEDVFLTGLFYKLNTTEFNKINRSQYSRGTDFKEDIVE